MLLEGRATKSRMGASRCFIRYDFTFRQGETLIYSSDQSAMWMKVAES